MRFVLQAGLTLRQGMRTLELVRELDGGEYLVEDVITRRPVVYTGSELLAAIYSDKLTVICGVPAEAASLAAVDSRAVVDLGSLTERERRLLEYRLLYVKALDRKRVTRGQRALIKEVIRKVAASEGDTDCPSSSSVMGWARKYQLSGMNPLALVDRHRMRRSPLRVNQTVEALIWKTLKRCYFTKERHTLRYAHDQLLVALKRARLNQEIEPDDADVGYSTLQRRVKDVDRYHRVATREGVSRARMVCRTAFPDGVASYPLERVEIDHTPLNWVVICDRTGMPLGRPTLTVAIDAYSGYVLGFYLSFYGPGVTSVSGVLKNAIMPKDDIVRGAGLKHPWLAFGMGDEYVVDNGLEFHSFAFKTMAMTLGSDVMYCRVRTPWLKPHVERFFATLNTLTLVKGRVSKTVANVMRIDPYKDAAITFSDLVQGLLQFCVDVHPHEPNWRKMATSFDLFSDGLALMPPVSFPGNMQDLRLATGMSKQLKLGQGGIEMLGLPYGSYQFKDIINKHGSGLDVLCKWDPDDISRLYVQDPSSRTWHTADCRWRDYAEGLSFNQHRLCRQFARMDLKSPEREQSLLDSRMRLHNHWLDATSRRGRADALKAGRYADMTSAKVVTGTAADPVSPMAGKVVSPAEAVISAKDVPTFESFSWSKS